MMAANSVPFVFAIIILDLKIKHSTSVKIDDKKHMETLLIWQGFFIQEKLNKRLIDSLDLLVHTG